MPTDHAEVTLRDVRVPDSTIFGEEGAGLAVAQTFVHENRIRQAASGVGAGQYCIDRSVEYARERRITKGAEEIQMRKVAGYLFGFAGPRKVGRG
jgi:alkylation response protein AidB-like acyl-CoA dehydrogenase